jgi:hypothetical protein
MHPGRLASVQSWLPALACHGDGGIHSGDGAGIPAYFISIVTTFWSIEETLFADWLGVTDVLSANCYRCPVSWHRVQFTNTLRCDEGARPLARVESNGRRKAPNHPSSLALTGGKSTTTGSP